MKVSQIGIVNGRVSCGADSVIYHNIFKIVLGGKYLRKALYARLTDDKRL